MKLSEIKNGISPEWAAKGYQMPTFDILYHLLLLL